ncbi:MAG: DUF4432 family protein [Pseudomonadota bacterium]
MTNTWTDAERRHILERSFDARGLGGISQYQLSDGPQRGQRIIAMRSARGLEARVCVDRGFDIASLIYKGTNIGWMGPSDFPAPMNPEADNGLGLLRSFDGFLVTCGLDHWGIPGEGPAEHLIYPHRSRVYFPLHGRVSGIPATIESAGTVLDAEEPFCWCTGIVRQAIVFGEVLELRRTIKMPLLGAEVHVEDTVINRGARPVRHGLLYHCNLGYPLLDARTHVTGVGSELEDRMAKAPPTPGKDVVESFDLVERSSAEPIVVANPDLGDLTLTLIYSEDTLPNLGIWQAYQSGLFALGIEPHSSLNSPDDPVTTESQSTLGPDETRRYTISVSITS